MGAAGRDMVSRGRRCAPHRRSRPSLLENRAAQLSRDTASFVGQVHFAQIARGINNPINLHPIGNDAVKHQPTGHDQDSRFRRNIWPSRPGLRKNRQLAQTRLYAVDPVVGYLWPVIGGDVKPDFGEVAFRDLGKPNLTQLTCPLPSESHAPWL